MKTKNDTDTHCLFPGPVSRHEILETVLAVRTVFLERCKVEFTFELGVGNHFLKKKTGIAKPYVVVGGCPCWAFAIRSQCFGWGSIVI